MKRNHHIIRAFSAMAAMLLAIGACSEIDVENESNERPILLSASRAFDATRAVVTTDVQSAQFDADELINVFITGSSDDVEESNIGEYPSKFKTLAPKDNANPMVIADPDKQPYYHVGNHSKAKIFAAYPANSDVNVTPDMTTFTVQEDQRTERAYKNSDLMLVPPFEHYKTASIVPLPFKHKMVKLIVTAIADDGVTVDPELTIGGVKRSVDIDVANGDFKKGVDGQLILSDKTDGKFDSDNKPVLPTIQILNGGAVVFPPQQVSTDRFIMVSGTYQGQPCQAQFDIIDKNFLEGRVYKLNLHIGKDDFTPNPVTGAPHVSTITGWSAAYDELTVTPSGGYAGVQIADIDNHILEMDETVTSADIEKGSYIYNGEERRPKPTVTYGNEHEITLIEGTDFKYTYVDNINAGSAQVMIIGQGAYTGLAALKPFIIRKATAKISFPENCDKEVTFNPDSTMAAVLVNNTGDGDVKYEADDTEPYANSSNIVGVDPVDGEVTMQNVGTARIKATATDGRNYRYPTPDSVATYLVKINPKPANDPSISIDYEPKNFTFDGTYQRLTRIVVADGEHTLIEGTDYDTTFTNNYHSGDAELRIKAKGNYTLDTLIKIHIAQAKPTITVKNKETALLRRKPLWMGVHANTAPVSRRKKLQATTEEWATSNLRFSIKGSTNVAEVNATTGTITGKKFFTDASVYGEGLRGTRTPRVGSTFVVVSVAADTQSGYQDWEAADTVMIPISVIESDFTFKIARHSYEDYRDLQLKIMSNGIPEGAHQEWTPPVKAKWQIDCYGAQGGTTPRYTTERTKTYRTGNTNAGPPVKVARYGNQGMGGRGAHIAARIELPKGKKLHINLGQQGRVVYPGEQRLRWKTLPSDSLDAATRKTSDRGSNGGKVNGDLGTIKAGDYEWAAFAWNGGGGMVWGAHNMYLLPTFYVQDNGWVGNPHTEAWSPGAMPEGGSWGSYPTPGQSYAMFPITSGGGATDVSLAFDETDGVYTPPTSYTDADRTSKTNYTYINNKNGGRTVTNTAADQLYKRAGGGTFELWMTAHNMVNREKGVGVDGDDAYTVGLQWKNPAHLFSRIIVAGGGGGGLYYDSAGTFGDGGQGGAWNGTRGLFQDYGEGAYINAGGRGGIWRNWKMGKPGRSDDRTDEYTCTGSTTNYPSDIVYNDGPNGGGWSGTDGMFGEGGNTFQPAQGCGGGGGGWYGGGAGNEDGSNGPGGGGSSFVWTNVESVQTYSSSSATDRSNYGVNHSVTWGTARPLYQNYDKIDADYQSYNGFKPEKWHKLAANFYKFMPTNSSVDKTSSGRNSTAGIECPFFYEIVTKDAGANAGDGWATITLVEIDDDQ